MLQLTFHRVWTVSVLEVIVHTFLIACGCIWLPCDGGTRPAALQDVVAGDGTTSVVVICGALLKKAQEMLEKGIHPTVISDSFNRAANKACEVRRRSGRHCISGCFSLCQRQQQVVHVAGISSAAPVLP